MRKPGKRIVIGSAGLIVAVIAAIGAYAYWTAGGSGSGTATAASGNNNLTIAATGWAGLAPGVTNPVTVTVTNPNAYVAHVNHVTLDTSFGGGTGVTTSVGGCLSSWFSVDTASINPNVDIAAGGNTGSVAYGNITMSSPASVDQGACKGADITIHFTSD